MMLLYILLNIVLPLCKGYEYLMELCRVYCYLNACNMEIQKLYFDMVYCFDLFIGNTYNKDFLIIHTSVIKTSN